MVGIGAENTRMTIVFTGGRNFALGEAWRVVAKRRDFYFEPASNGSPIMHLSIHGPGPRHSGHRFHIKVDDSVVEDQGYALHHNNIPRGGVVVSGNELIDGVFHVVRMRWSWHLQRERFVDYVANGRSIDLDGSDSGLKLSRRLNANSNWDIDFYVSYTEPYIPRQGGLWKDEVRPEKNNAVLGPLVNESGMWLTGISCHRSEMIVPTPSNLIPPLPRCDEVPSRITVGGSDESGVYWFNETVTSKNLVTGDVASARASWPEAPGWE